MYKETDMREKRGIKTNGSNNIETGIDGMKVNRYPFLSVFY